MLMAPQPQPSGFFIDANLLVLLLVGRVSTKIIPRHRRLADYTVADYDALAALVGRADRIFVTPNTLTEASNLLRQHAEPERTRLMRGLAYLIDESEEIVIASGQASANPHFAGLGLADAVLLESVSAQTPLITVDMALYLAALEQEENAAFNFREFMVGSF